VLDPAAQAAQAAAYEEAWWGDEEDGYDPENETTVRGKWIYEGATSIDGMAAKLRREIRWLERMQREGWYLEDGGEDYFFLRRDRQ
jgi:hypothetical protein